MVLNSVRTRLAQLVPHVDRALSQLPATARVPAQRLFAQSKHVVNRMQPPPPDSELSAQLEWTFKADVHSAAALSASIASTMADRERYSLLVGKLYHVYAALEGALDSSSSPAVKQLWEAHGAQLRRAELLAADLREVDAWPPAPPSFETTCYLLALREAAADDEATGGARHPSPSPSPSPSPHPHPNPKPNQVARAFSGTRTAGTREGCWARRRCARRTARLLAWPPNRPNASRLTSATRRPEAAGPFWARVGLDLTLTLARP